LYNAVYIALRELRKVRAVAEGGQIADEFASQYTIGYISQNPKREGAWRRLAVQTARAGLTPRTKNGYYAPSSG
jgi:hypothetical protein